MGNFQSTVSLLRALPEFATPLRFTLVAPPVPRPIILCQPLPLCPQGWAYAGATSVCGLALAIMVCPDTMGALAPSRPAAISIQSSGIAAQSLPDPGGPEAGLSLTKGHSQPPIAAAEPRARAQQRIAATPESDSVLALRAAESPQQSAEAASVMAPAAADPQPETLALAAEAVPNEVSGEVPGAYSSSLGPQTRPAILASPPQPRRKIRKWPLLLFQRILIINQPRWQTRLSLA